MYEIVVCTIGTLYTAVQPIIGVRPNFEWRGEHPPRAPLTPSGAHPFYGGLGRGAA
jgi:hypothetical protein